MSMYKTTLANEKKHDLFLGGIHADNFLRCGRAVRWLTNGILDTPVRFGVNARICRGVAHRPIFFCNFNMRNGKANGVSPLGQFFKTTVTVAFAFESGAHFCHEQCRYSRTDRLQPHPYPVSGAEVSKPTMF